MKKRILTPLIIAVSLLISIIGFTYYTKENSQDKNNKAILIYREGEEFVGTQDEINMVLNVKIPQIIAKISKVINETAI